MSVLIRGMEMPRECQSCAFVRLSPTGESIYCCIDNSIVPWADKKKAVDCPLVPVPPHGDLIDRAVLIDSFEPSDFWNSSAEDNCFAAIHVTNSMPTIIPAEPAEEALRCDPCKPTQPECGTCEWAEEGKT